MIKYFLLLVLALGVFFGMFAYVEVNGKQERNIVKKLVVSLMGSLIICTILGLPILRIICLIKIGFIEGD